MAEAARGGSAHRLEDALHVHLHCKVGTRRVLGHEDRLEDPFPCAPLNSEGERSPVGAAPVFSLGHGLVIRSGRENLTFRFLGLGWARNRFRGANW
jgi:hypothetical protein